MMNRIQSPTIADVARLAGVSIATVSRVINKNVPVSNETKKRVEAAISSLDFVPHPAARMLASRRTKTIGLVMSDIGGAFFSPLLRGIETGVRQAGFNLLVSSTGDDEGNKKLHSALGEQNTDGLLVFANSLESQELEHLDKIGFPVVLMHQSPPAGIHFPTVTIENKNGAYKIVSHLIQVHHKHKIVFVMGPSSHEDSTWRQRGYQDALASNGIPYDERLIIKGEFNDEIAYHAMAMFLATGQTFDAVFSADDDSASGVLLALRESGKKVPQEIAVVGFDDAPFSPYLTPPLTTIHAPTEIVGLTAIQHLLSLVQTGQVETLTLLPTDLIIRNSCGC